MPHILVLLGGMTAGAMTMSKLISLDSQIPPSPKPPKRSHDDNPPPLPAVIPVTKSAGRDLVAAQRRRIAENEAKHQANSAPQPAPSTEIPLSIDPNEAMAKWIIEEIIVTGVERDEVHESLLIGNYFDYCDQNGFGKVHPADVLQGLINFSDMRGYAMAQDEKGVWLTHGKLRKS